MTNIGPSEEQINSIVSILSIGKFKEALEKTAVLCHKFPRESLLFNLRGACYQGLGQLDTAVENYQKAIAINPSFYKAHYNLGGLFHELGMLDASIESFEKALSIKPDYAEANNNIGNVFKELGHFDNAIKSFEKAIEIKPSYFEAHFSLGEIFQDLNNITSAIRHYEVVLLIKPDFAELHNNLAVLYLRIDDIDSALKHLKEAVRISPEFAEAFYNLGHAYKELNQSDKSLDCYKNAIAMNPHYAEPHYASGNILQDLGQFDKAVKCYQMALIIEPDKAEVHYELGNISYDLGQFNASIESYEKAISIDSNNSQFINGMGIVLNKTGQFEKALKCYKKAISINPEYAEVYFNLGNLQWDLNEMDEAVSNYEYAIKLKPGIDFNFGNLFHCKMHLCNWDNFSINLKEIHNRINNSELTIDPFSLSALIDDAKIQLKNAKIFSKEITSKNNALSKKNSYLNHKKIRIGYFSADFREHPVSFLSAKLYELHDRSHFEIFAFSFGPNTQDEMNLRIKAGVDKFYNVEKMSNNDIALLSRSLEIDIAIDLGGFTANNKAEIFAVNPAPIQINYLGYPGTMGADFYDYIIADKIIIPEEQKRNYSENIIYLPSCYMPQDSSRQISNKLITRQECNLPEDGFVFCSFNNSFKITPKEFDIWMRLLSKIDGSVLWLLKANKSSEDNLKSEAKKRGVEPNRLIFADKIAVEEHLARQRLADLFLDTFNFNAHTTASDALWAGLPVLTKIGKGFAARVAGSLLTSLEVPELITNSEKEYEALALNLASNPEKLATIKKKLADKRTTAPLFDTKTYTKNLEKAYTQAFERYTNGLPPQEFEV
ncbi:tetratricopeptide repeat protein [Candidatus Thioglobus sp. NP1]|uniref:tetratricopeptide repeat protein n=1 Tax=Candidatus Thioglobus sp. NP1 TaxID=2508687 RepID=UPI000DEDA09B|nr:tetratricopeptide repeat protein [Candidatus Thioglobus sp. NP1]AXE61830.1 hypothetical protein CRN91_03985 [Candidatus Thioglobus sp. NP1]